MKRHGPLFAAATISVIICSSGRQAAAQGYGLYEQGACTMAMAGAAVADPCSDGSAMFFNPAALAAIEGSVFAAGGTLVGPFGNFTSDTGVKTDLEDKFINVPNLYYARDLGSRAKIGLGIMAPYGLEIGWPLDFSGRFLAYKAKLQAAYFQPTVAFKVNDQVMVGGGFDISYAKVELRRRADLSVQRIPGTTLTFAALGVPGNTDFADIILEGDSVQFGFHLGTLMKVNDRFSVGARYQSRLKVETDEGDFETDQIATGLRTPVPLPGLPAGTPLDALLAPQFATGATLADQQVATSLYLPDQFVVGVMFKPADAVKVKVDYQFVNWSLFDVLVIEAENGLTDINYENYKDTHGVRIGTEFAVSPTTDLRAGILTHSAGAPDETVTPLLPEGARWEFTVGLGHRFNDLFGLDLAYQYLFQPDRRGRTSNGGVEQPTTAVNDGEYAFRANLLGLNLVLRW